LQLTSLNLSFQPTIPADGLQTFSQNITTLTSLTCSDIKSINGTDLFLIADCFPLLEKLDLRHPKVFENYEIFINGIEAFCSALFKLRKVNLTCHHYINDQLLFDLFKNLKFLEEIIIVDCKQITNAGVASALRQRPTLRSLSFSNNLETADNATFFALISNGPSLTEINLVHYKWKNSVDNSNLLMDVAEIPQLESLSLACSYYWGLSDERIIIFVSLFPNLQRLDLTLCYNISEEGICQVLKRCRKIRHLDLSCCSQLKLLGLNFEVPKLEVLNLSRTNIKDETLYVISKRCRRLLQLLLEDCKNVTEKGVKHVVDNCTQLREINLTRYPKVHANVAASIICSRPSWREINISI
jgi:F-box/leucine-rich repeat protein 2/20